MSAPSSSSLPPQTLTLTLTLIQHPLSSPTTRPPLSDLAAAWILEFILRQPLPDSLLNEIFLSLPFSSSDLHPRLRKALLLRRISSDLRRSSISDRTLHSLELIAELDRRRGCSPSRRLRAAYCAAAVECAAEALLRGEGDFVDAVGRIWLADAAEGLVSELFLEWGRKMERCVCSGGGGEEVLKRDVGEAVGAVEGYLEEALEEIGMSFLEVAAAEFVEKGVDLDAAAVEVGRKGFVELNGCFEKLDEAEDGEGGVLMGGMEEDGVAEGSGGRGDGSVRDLGVGGVREEFRDLGEASAMQEDNERGVNVGGQDMPDHGRCNIHQIDPGEVRKVKNALKKSCFDLKMVVEDPLPEAQAAAAAVLNSLSRGHALLNEKEKQNSAENPILPSSHVDGAGDLEKEKCNSSDSKQMEGDHIFEACNNDVRPRKRRGGVACSLDERNPTADTIEGSDDSLEWSASMENHQSPKPMLRRVSLKGNLVKRRPVKRWTALQENTLREAVAKYGTGNWKLILNCNSQIFEERTEVDLKDKWRNMTRH